jgi:probable F420-dependent oxidoreductase
MIEPSFYLPLAVAAEEAGYDSFIVPDSICYPAVSDARYPYTPDGDRSFIEDKPFLEPFSLIPAMGAVTSRLRFVTSVLKLTIRHPVLVAKQATSTAVLTGGRLVLGIGTSPWPEDYEVTGVPWAGRGKRTDEMLAIMRGLETGDWFEFHGEAFDIPAIKVSPVPPAPVPIIVGGHGGPALRRAARLGDGWIHGGGGDGRDLPAMLKRLGQLRRDAGREHDPFEVHVISLDAYTVDGIRRLQELGVTDVIVGFRYPYTRAMDTEPLSTKIDALRRYAETVMLPFRSA